MPQIYDMGLMALLPLRRKVCWGFLRPKNPIRPGLNPQTWVLKASMLPLDHQSWRVLYQTNLRNSAFCCCLLLELTNIACFIAIDTCYGKFFLQVRSHFKILSTIRVTCSKLHSEETQVLGSPIQNVVTKVTWHPRFVHACLSYIVIWMCGLYTHVLCSFHFVSGFGFSMYCSWCRSGRNGKWAQTSVALDVTVKRPVCVLLHFRYGYFICLHCLAFSHEMLPFWFRYGFRRSFKPFAYLLIFMKLRNYLSQ